MRNKLTEMGKKQLAFYFDSSSCSGCKTCQVACKDKHDSGEGILWRRVYEAAGGDWVKDGNAWVPNVYSYYISMACNHCVEPLCLYSCPNNAIVKNDDGIVLIEKDRCMGCRYCEWNCPYGALQFDKSQGVMTKCTFCDDYLAEGKKPSCITACPMRVLDIGELEELEKEHGKSNEIFPMPRAHYTQPAIVVKPHRDARMAENVEMKIDNLEEIKNEQ